MVTIGPSARTLLKHYPEMQRECDIATPHGLWMRHCLWTGEVISEPHSVESAAAHGSASLKSETTRLLPQAHQRPKFHAMLCRQLQRFGIPIESDLRVVEYYEDAERGIGGVVTEGGERFEADIVIAADGTNSSSEAIIADPAPMPQPTNRTVFRAAFPLAVAAADPLVNETFGLWEGRHPFLQIWMGPGTYTVFQSYVDKYGHDGRLCFAMVLPDPDGKTRRGSWNEPVSKEETLRVIDCLPGWSEALKALIRITPPDTIFAWPLSPRSPKWCWHSPGMRVLQLGDAAHPMTPTAGNGATQAIEDAITVAACLAHAGKDQVTTAVQVHNLLRAERVSCCQLMAFINDERLDKFDFGSSSSNKSSKMTWKSNKWLTSFDPEEYADANYAKAAASLCPGGPEFRNTNYPPGHKVKPWTVEEMNDLRERGCDLDLTGDWS